jgi:hypothetical protein
MHRHRRGLLQTTALSHGFTLKGRRFFSGTGYLNEIHSHNWTSPTSRSSTRCSSAASLPRTACSCWVAPTDYFLELGAELGNGNAFPGTHRNSNAFASDALFVHLGNDIGDSTSWRLGVSWLDQRATDRTYDDVDEFDSSVTNALPGPRETWIADATLKWAPHGNPTQHQFKLQAAHAPHRGWRARLRYAPART